MIMTYRSRTIRRSITIAFVLLFGAVRPGLAQVNPDEIRDPELKALEKSYLAEIRAVNLEIARLRFPFPFLLNRYVGLDLKQQVGADTRGLEFVKFHHGIVLKVTGNYNAAYNATVLTDNQRAGKVVEEVISPILGILCRDLSPSNDYSRLGFEISFHVRQRKPGYDYEGKEILVLVLDRQDALAYVKSHDTAERQEILERSEVYLNGKPYGLVLGERDPYPVGDGDVHRTVAAKPASGGLHSLIMAPRANTPLGSATPKDETLVKTALQMPLPASAVLSPAISPSPMKGTDIPVKVAVEPLEKLPASRDTSPDAIKELQKSYQSRLDRMVPELESQAHFVRYAPPALIPFHNGVYVQVSVNTILAPTAAGSQYRLAALAFDQHIAHLIRPVLAYFKDRRDFDGIDFSTTVRLTSSLGADGNPMSVEFIFPLKLVNAYADFDSTGQQLIDASFVLINGERVSLNLQAAEAGSPAH
jgi:hypothetical protein